MESYKISIEVAILVFPIIAFILTTPFLIHQYQKYGAIPFFKSVIFYSLILYLITAYFMVILPLPTKAFVANLKTSPTQLIPFNFIKDIKLTTSLHINDLNSLLQFLNKPTVYTVLFNFLLTMPFGFYLRYFFKKKWYQTIFYTFLLSLFFELTQLSALYGYYPRPYRIFDVDDLIINTTGGFLGHLFAPLLMFFLPSQAELEAKSYSKGQKVTSIRRLLAFFIDILFIILFNIVIQLLLYNTKLENYSFLITITLYYLLLPLITKGQTIGKNIVKIKVSGINQEAKWYQLFFRNFIFTYIIVFPFVWIDMLDKILVIKYQEIIFISLKIIFGTLQIINFIYYIVSIFNKDNLFLYEKITKTKNISTIIVDKNFIEHSVDNIPLEAEPEEDKIQKHSSPKVKKKKKNKN